MIEELFGGPKCHTAPCQGIYPARLETCYYITCIAKAKKYVTCVSGYLSIPKFWLLTLKFLEQRKYSFSLSERFFVFRSSNHCYTASVRSWIPCEYIQQIQLLTISQKKCESNKTQQNGNENGECYTMLWGSSCITNFSFAKCDLLPEGKQIIISIPGSSQCMQMIFEEHHTTVPWQEVFPVPATSKSMWSTRKTIDAFQVLMTTGSRAFTMCRQLFIKRRSLYCSLPSITIYTIYLY